MNTEDQKLSTPKKRNSGEAKKWIKRLITLAVLGGLGWGGWYGYQTWQESNKPPIHFKTSKVEQRDFQITIEATGTLEPEDLIDVGARVGGEIIEFGTDLDNKEVNDSSLVKKGQILARIDDVLIQSDLKEAEATVSQAKAGISLAEADLENAKIQYEQTQRDRQRAEKLGPSEALARVTYENYITSERSAKASIAVKEASVEQAKANLIKAEATLQRQKRNLSYTSIVSPVDGVVIKRVVNIGQTVNAGMNTPSLFLVAPDLSKMKIWAAVNEADIGSISPGQDVVFEVDAFSDRKFTGVVDKIRLNATMSSNVVTYIVEVLVPNKDKTLIPYLTANTQFIVKTFKDALVVPNTALRWEPDEMLISPNAGEPTPNAQYVWVQEDNFVKPIAVKVKENNGSLSVVESDGLKDGMRIITGLAEAPEGGMGSNTAASNEAVNPFAPKFPKRNAKKTTPSGGRPH